jgi:ribose 5-phosphate isomerase B
MGILICGSGLGMSMAANRIKGIRAALCHNVGIAEIARYHNDANVLILDGDYASEKDVDKIVDRFFNAKFSNISRYKRRIKKLDK